MAAPIAQQGQANPAGNGFRLEIQLDPAKRESREIVKNAIWAPVSELMTRLQQRAPYSKYFAVVADSAPLRQLLEVSVITAAQLATIENDRIMLKDKSFCDSMPQRVRFGEVWFMANASLVYNFFIAVGSTLVAGICLGQYKNANEAFKKYWVHVGIAFEVTLAAFAGIWTPKYGAIAGALAAAGPLILIAKVQKFEGKQADVLNDIREVFAAHRQDFIRFATNFLPASAAGAEEALDAVAEDLRQANSLRDVYTRLRARADRPIRQIGQLFTWIHDNRVVIGQVFNGVRDLTRFIDQNPQFINQVRGAFGNNPEAINQLFQVVRNDPNGVFEVVQALHQDREGMQAIAEAMRQHPQVMGQVVNMIQNDPQFVNRIQELLRIRVRELRQAD